MSTITLENNSSLNKMRRQARLLQAGFLIGRPEALALVKKHDPAPGSGPKLALHKAQLVVARAHGFSSWAKLKRYFEVAADLRFDGGKPARDESAADRLCRLGSLYDQDDSPEQWAAARELLHSSPELPAVHIWAAASAADLPAVQAHLTRDRSLATRRGGPHRWTPLYYLAYSRLNADAPEAAVLGIAELLLNAGADPNEGYLWGGQPTPFTVLTGAFGEGELGPERQPRHPHAQQLARLLLTAGADANDAQTLYNRMFQPTNDHLQLLFAFGLGRGDGGPWRARLRDAVDSPTELLRYQLWWAIDHGFADRVRLLVAHGTDLSVKSPSGHTPVEAALVVGRPEIASILRDAGAPAADLKPADQLIAAALVADRSAVDRIVAQHPEALAEACRQRPGVVVWAASNGFIEAVRLLVQLGFSVDARGRGDTPVEQQWETPLHQAAGDGNADLVRLLLELGADPTIKDRRFQATPAGWAGYFGHSEVAAILEGAVPADQ